MDEVQKLKFEKRLDRIRGHIAKYRIMVREAEALLDKYEAPFPATYSELEWCPTDSRIKYNGKPLTDADPIKLRYFVTKLPELVDEACNQAEIKFEIEI